MPKKDEVARKLARMHYRVEDGITQIFRFTNSTEASPAEPIKLLEVNENTIPSGIMPLQFAPIPSRGLPYSSVIIEVTPSEFQRIRKNELPLPAGWETQIPMPKGKKSSE